MNKPIWKKYDESIQVPGNRYTIVTIFKPDLSETGMFVRQDAPFEGKLIMPGGKIYEGESALDSAKRELARETGQSADKFSELEPINCKIDGDNIIYYFAAVVNDPEVDISLGEENVGWVDTKEVLSMNPELLAPEVIEHIQDAAITLGYNKDIDIEDIAGKTMNKLVKNSKIMSPERSMADCLTGFREKGFDMTLPLTKRNLTSSGLDYVRFERQSRGIEREV